MNLSISAAKADNLAPKTYLFRDKLAARQSDWTSFH